jgi:hypothetical protein
MILSTLSHANFKCDWEINMKFILKKIISIQEFQFLPGNEIQTFKNLCIIYDIPTQVCTI